MNIYNINPNFINALRSKYPTILIHKNDKSDSGGRKYIGVVMKIKDFNYYIPISSPHDHDYYFDSEGNKKIKDDDIFTLRMKHIQSKTGEEVLDGSFKIGNMIPIPESEISIYNINAENNEYLRNKLWNVYKFMKINAKTLNMRAKKLIRLAEIGNKAGELKFMPFKDLQNDVALYTFNRFLYLHNNEIDLSKESFYYPEDRNKLYRVIAFDKNYSEYFIALPQKDLDNQVLKNAKIFSFDQGICIKDEIGEQLEKKGLPSANRILKSKIKRYNQTDTIHKEKTGVFIL